MRHTKTITAPNPGPLTLGGTNTYVFGNVVIDPGPDTGGHLERIASTSNVEIILLTHRHPDHASGAAQLSGMTDAPILAFGNSVSDGEEVAGLVALHTPGHARDHLCFWDARTGTLFSGDLIAGRGSIMVAPPEGDLRDYMDSLHRVKNLSPERILPGHGPEITDARSKTEEYIRHREEREALIVSALDAGADSIRSILKSAYADTPEDMLPYAEMALKAHLIKLGRTDLI